MDSRQFAALWYILLAIAYGVLGKKDAGLSTLERAKAWYKMWNELLDPKS